MADGIDARQAIAQWVGHQPTSPADLHEYIHDGPTRRVVWAVWAPHDKPGTTRMKLSDVPGRLLSSTRMPLADGPAPDGGAKQHMPGQVELDVSGSPVYLNLGK